MDYRLFYLFFSAASPFACIIETPAAAGGCGRFSFVRVLSHDARETPTLAVSLAVLRHDLVGGAGAEALAAPLVEVGDDPLGFFLGEPEANRPALPSLGLAAITLSCAVQG